MSLRKAYNRLRADSGCTWHIRMQLLRPGFTRLIMSFHEDPLQEWKLWCDRVRKRYPDSKIPGNWATRRGIKKRQRALLRYG